jgi:hypothetical protein
VAGVDVAGRREQGERARGGGRAQFREGRGGGLGVELGAVAAGELGEPVGVVAEPAPQLGAGRDVAQPAVVVGVGLRQAARQSRSTSTRVPSSGSRCSRRTRTVTPAWCLLTPG